MPMGPAGHDRQNAYASPEPLATMGSPPEVARDASPLHTSPPSQQGPFAVPC